MIFDQNVFRNPRMMAQGPVQARPRNCAYKQVRSRPFCLVVRAVCYRWSCEWYLQRSTTNLLSWPATYTNCRIGMQVLGFMKYPKSYFVVWPVDGMDIVAVQAQSAVGTKSGIFKPERLWSGTGRGNATRLPLRKDRIMKMRDGPLIAQIKIMPGTPGSALINLGNMTRDGEICEMYGIN